jgi:peptidyl-prolyl cis-trans isomerase SurA
MITTRAMSRGACAATMVLLGMVAARAGRAEIVNRVVATVDGEPITAHEVDLFAKTRPDMAASAQGALEALITERLLEREADAQGIKARDEDVDAYIQQVKERGRMDDAHFQSAMSARGMTLDSYRAQVRADIEKTQLVQKEIRGRVTVSAEEIKRYYDAHQDDYRLGDEITVRDIFFPLPSADQDAVEQTRAKAEEVRTMAAGGKSFEALAAQYSSGPGADKGGLLGTFRRGEMTHELDEAAFRLKPKQVSPVITTSRGFHILEVDSMSESKLKPLKDVEGDIREQLYKDALETRFTDWLTKDLRERHHVEVLN